MNRQRLGVSLLGIGFLYALIFSSLAGWHLVTTLRTHTFAEVQASVWAFDRPLFVLWAFSVPVGALVAVLGALIHAGIGKRYLVLTGVGFLLTVFLMTMLFTRFYASALFGVGGVVILVLFFGLLWFWMRGYRAGTSQEKAAAVLQLTGYLFFVAASWFLCGEFAPLRLKAFATRGPPSPIEIMAYLVLGWLFLLLSHRASSRAARAGR